MRVSAFVQNAGPVHHVTVTTGGNAQRLAIASRVSGSGSSINGEEAVR
jgi:hypothetical protein